MIELSMQDRKALQIEMLSEFDAFCRANQIKYSLAYGTLLGAVRHKGYIPWDDDIDVMMPLPDLMRLKKCFRSDTIKYCDIDTQRGYDMDFPRLTSLKTFKYEGKGIKSYGVFIDVYPVLGLPNSLNDEDTFFKKLGKLECARKQFLLLRRRVMNRIPIHTIPLFKRVVKRIVEHEFSTTYNNSHRYYIASVPIAYKDKNIFDFNLFDNLIELEFEGKRYYCIACYERFLSHRYGDYMQLPPESERHPYHNAVYYWI